MASTGPTEGVPKLQRPCGVPRGSVTGWGSAERSVTLSEEASSPRRGQLLKAGQLGQAFASQCPPLAVTKHDNPGCPEEAVPLGAGVLQLAVRVSELMGVQYLIEGVA